MKQIIAKTLVMYCCESLLVIIYSGSLDKNIYNLKDFRHVLSFAIFIFSNVSSYKVYQCGTFMVNLK